jgi:hypothetical protein
LAGCTETVDRTQVTFSVDADSIVRDEAARVDVVVETQGSPNAGWELQTSQRFAPMTQHRWPIELSLPPESFVPGKRYQLSATARDSQGSVVGQVMLIRASERSKRILELAVRFEAACFRRSQPCGEVGRTCRAGECVSPEYDPQWPQAGSSAPDRTSDAGDGGGASGAADDGGLATPGEPCADDAARGCDGHASRTPLLCTGGAWTAEPECPENERCDSRPGATQGRCQPIARECQGRMPGAAFCAADESMRECEDLVFATRLPCDQNELCTIDPTGKPICSCRTPFTDDGSGAGCRAAMSCGEDNGGCDRHTECSLGAGGPICGDCPPGYAGTGNEGCAPLLRSLTVPGHELSPAFTPGLTSYRVELPLLAQRVAIRATGPEGSILEVNGAALTEGMEWSSPPLALGETTLEVVVASESGERSSYLVTLERKGLQEAQLKARAPEERDQFGFAVGISGDTLVVGATYEDGGSPGINGDDSKKGAADSGAAFVFVREGDRWIQQAYLKASDPRAGDHFGGAVAVDGDTIVVGAIRDDQFSLSSTPTQRGTVYVFERTAGRWEETARLEPAASAVGDLFGYYLALEGNTLIASAARASTTTTASGAVHVFEREARTWHERATLQPSTPIRNSLFGEAVAIAGDTVAVSSLEGIGSADEAGAVYVFVRRDSGWDEQQRLQAEPPAGGAYFGYRIALSGDTLVVGAPSPDLLLVTPHGQVSVFDRVGERWSRTAVLTAAVPRPSDYFGASVALNGSTLLVGASGDPSGSRGIPGDPTRTDAPYSGSAYLFEREGDQWIPTAFLKVMNTARDQGLGWSAALSGDTAVVGANVESTGAGGVNPRPTSGSRRSSGAVYVFR